VGACGRPVLVGEWRQGSIGWTRNLFSSPSWSQSQSLYLAIAYGLLAVAYAVHGEKGGVKGQLGHVPCLRKYIRSMDYNSRYSRRGRIFTTRRRGIVIRVTLLLIRTSDGVLVTCCRLDHFTGLSRAEKPTILEVDKL